MKRSALLPALPALALLLAGCGGTAGAEDGRPSVVASFYPFAFVTEQVGGSLVQVDNLTSPGVEPHDIELAPQQVGDLQDADLVVFETGFQAAVDDAVETADRDAETTVDVADVVDLLPAAEGEEHSDEEHEGEEHEGEEGHEDHDHGDVDPHTWLNPANMVKATRAVEASLAEVDPANAETYATNADAFVAQLEDLDADFTAGLETCETRTIVTSHAAFAYLADRYDLTQVPIAGIDPSNEPSPRDLADITTQVREDDITTIFTEELVSPAVAETIADETGAEIATLDPIEGLGSDTSDETYLTLMENNLEALRTANSCS